LAAGPGPQAHLLAPVWVASGLRSRLHYEISLRLAFDITVNEQLLRGDDERVPAPFIQINAARGAPWRSRSLGDDVLPFDPSMLSASQDSDWTFDDVSLPDGRQLRRVLYHTAVLRMSAATVRLPTSAASDHVEGMVPRIVVQCACDRSDRDDQT